MPPALCLSAQWGYESLLASAAAISRDIGAENPYATKVEVSTNAVGDLKRIDQDGLLERPFFVDVGYKGAVLLLAALLLPPPLLITGCSEGDIGVALASAFLTKGYHVFATAREAAKIPINLSSSPGATLLILDVFSAQSIASAVASVDAQTNGTLDVLVNNSGEPMIMPLLDSPIEDRKNLFDVLGPRYHGTGFRAAAH
ncbi:hypothetical protein F5X68DRAFT_265052 [Plectosphaerella plurivora]|uniref:Uncharacterized protein n=1 Tax=Plectosphaerella plurivora TaxID=936078 RepID=A0A9P8V3B5_9PEZI|nr:hypothetical protein F5X68DRAFT_265052 [Plectosphaerella plurivora]